MDIRDALKELCEEVKLILAERINRYGINSKTGTNTLQGSELEKSIEVKPIEEGIALSIADYWEYVSLGWKRTHRFEGTMSLFIRNIDDWIRRKGITFKGMTQSQMVFLITRNIMMNGLKARPFMVYDEEGDLEKMIPELKGIMDKWFDDLYQTITNDLDKFFN